MHPGARSAAFVALALLLAACDAVPPDERAPSGDAAACAPALPDVPHAYSDGDAPIPYHFLASTAGSVQFRDNTPPDNRITNAGATLGRVLFYDTRLSANGRLSCASCHRQEFGFTDTLRFSPGLHGEPGRRRTMALGNARFNPAGRFFWDERAPTLEAAVLEPLRHRGEMGIALEALEDRLAETPFYPGLFAAAFGSPAVTRDRTATALAQFIRSLVSARSRFDAVFTGGGAPDLSVLTDREREGWRLFNSTGCVNCHRSIAQFADQSNNTGLDRVAADTGAGGGRFKPPSLRNVAVRGPYMHDGRFATLAEVIDFYDSGVKTGPDLDPRLRGPDGGVRRLGLTPRDAGALIAFLESLTDTAFLADSRFSSPFAPGC